ncbi:MAG: nuclear transport factor 2 family protein [Chitinophagaceae bacterium]|nr:nuclear transport factor 2 family protein [Chitinophagaceae bacterium]
MKKYILLFSCCISLSQFSGAQTKEEETEAIKTVCNYYLDGGTNGDSIMFSKAFSPTGQMQYMRNDTLVVVSLKDFMSRMRHTLKKTERTTSISSVEVYGNAAIAKLTIEYPTFYFHDIMSLLKTRKDGRLWGRYFTEKGRDSL